MWGIGVRIRGVMADGVSNALGNRCWTRMLPWRRPLECQHPGAHCRLDECRLRYAVGRALGRTDQSMRRGDADNAARPALLDQVPPNLLGHEKAAGQVGRDHLVPLRPGDLYRALAEIGAGIVDEQIEMALTTSGHCAGWSA